MEDYVRVAHAAAEAAGRLQMERLGNLNSIDYKSAFNIVTDVDQAAEKEIIRIIRETFPADAILGEESGAHETGSARRWLIDPIDGTTNYAHAYPFFCVSIGFEADGQMIFGVVFNAFSREKFWAHKGKGAWLNDKQIRVSSIASLNESLLATGFPPDSKNARLANMIEFQHITDISHGVRRDGSAALDLAYVACGRIEGFWEFKLAPWDLAAGTLIVQEAGGKITSVEGGSFDMNSGHVLATNDLIHDQVIEAIAASRTEYATRHV